MSADWGWYKTQSDPWPGYGLSEATDASAGQSRAPSAAWMVTFSDLTLLLLTFFVLLFSMSTLRTESWTSFLDGLSTRFDVMVERPTTDTSPDYSAEAVVPLPAEDLRYLQAVIAEAQAEALSLTTLSVIAGGDRLVLSLPAAVFGRAGEAAPLTVTPEGMPLLADLAALLARLDNRVQVAVTLDGASAVHGGRGRRTAWEAGLADAEAVAMALRGAGYPQAVDAVAHVESAAVAGGGAPWLTSSRPVSVVILPEGRE